MLEVEGGTPEWFMKLIRHEAAHAYSYAYHLPRKKKWQQTFGQTSREQTPDVYHPQPFSRSYVVNLDDWYAQSHPDEDFAETFAVWLTPEARLAQALRRLEGAAETRIRRRADALARRASRRSIRRNIGPREYDCLNLKLKTYYARKRKLYEDTYPDFYDADLRQLFSATPGPGRITAAVYLRRRRRRLLNSVCQWTNEKKFRVNKLLSRLIDRCDQLDLLRVERRSAAGFSRHLFHHDAGDELSVHRQIQAHQIDVKKKLKVLALFDAIRPTTIDQDLSKEMKTEDWKTEANVLAALGDARSHRRSISPSSTISICSGKSWKASRRT